MNDDADDDGTCSICREEMLLGKLECGHTICPVCVSNNVETCPFCRRGLKNFKWHAQEDGYVALGERSDGVFAYSTGNEVNLITTTFEVVFKKTGSFKVGTKLLIIDHGKFRVEDTSSDPKFPYEVNPPFYKEEGDFIVVNGVQMFNVDERDVYERDENGNLRVETTARDVVVPSGKYVSIHVKTISGRITMQNVQCDELNLCTASGEIFCEDTMCGTIDAKSVSGRIAVRVLRRDTTGRVFTHWGNVRIVGKCENLSVESVKGKVERF